MISCTLSNTGNLLDFHLEVVEILWISDICLCPWGGTDFSFAKEWQQSGRYNPVVPFNAIFADRLCLAEILLFASLGLLVGLSSTFGTYSGRWNTVMAARVASARPYSRLPAWPHGILGASVFSVIQLARSACRGFLALHLLFASAMVACALSTAFWLLLAASMQKSAHQERAARIEAFIADASAPVPARVPGLESAPPWFRAWNWINLAVFFLLMAQIVRWLLRQS